MSEEQFDKLMGAIKTLAKGLDGLAEGQGVLSDQIGSLLSVISQVPEAAPEAPAEIVKPKSAPKPKAPVKAHAKS